MDLILNEHQLVRERAIEIVTIETEVPRQFLMMPGHTGPRSISTARQLLMWLMWQSGKFSYPQIGRLLNRDHTTVLHGVHRIHNLRCQQIEWMSLTNRALQSLLEDDEATAADPRGFKMRAA